MLNWLPLLALVALPSDQNYRKPQNSRDVSTLGPVRKVQQTPNIVLILADDFGVDMVSGYAEGANPPCTPNIDLLAAEGMLFRNAWTNAVCSPTRAATLSGRYGFRTGVGGVQGTGDQGLLLSELIIPEMLTGYDGSAVGKWHLAGGQGNLHPNDSGFGRFAGTIRGGVMDYFQWSKIIDGTLSTSTTYATTDVADEGIAAVQNMQEPWFLYMNFHAPHSPWHEPDPSICPTPACATTYCGNLPVNPSNAEMGKAMVEAMDAELGRFLAALDAVDPDAYVFFMGDNGTPRQLTESPFVPTHAKGQMYEGGVNVPLIARGPGIGPAECAALVGSVDFFATFAELAGITASTEDSVSMVPYFTNPGLSIRETVYTERFDGNTPPYADHRRTIREARYKLIREDGEADELYDLLLDPFEANDLLPNLTPEQQDAFDALEAALVQLGVA